MSTVLLIAAVWLVMGSVVTYVWVTWRMRCNDHRTFQRVLRERDDDLDAELRDLIEDHRT